MKSLNDYFEYVYCIHVIGKEDRMNNIEKLIKDLNIQDLKLFEASTPDNIEIPDNLGKIHNCGILLPTEYACGHSHLRLLQEIIEREGPGRSLILEDDACINPEVNVLDILDYEAERALDNSVDLVQLGSNYKQLKSRRINDNLHHMTFGVTTHAYSPSVDMAKWIWNNVMNIEKFKSHKTDAIDTLFAKNMGSRNCRVFNPPLMYQMPCHSLIADLWSDTRKETLYAGNANKRK